MHAWHDHCEQEQVELQTKWSPLNAAGAFVYIALEIVLDDFSGPLLTRQAKLRRVLCFLAMLAGLTLVALLQMINDDPGS